MQLKVYCCSCTNNAAEDVLLQLLKDILKHVIATVVIIQFNLILSFSCNHQNIARNKESE